MRRAMLASWVLLAIVFGGSDPIVGMPSAAAQFGSTAAVRKFAFHYRFRVKGLKSTDDANANVIRVWLPCPPSDDYQDIIRLPSTAPGEISEHLEPRFDNRILFFQTRILTTGEFTVDVPYDVIRREVLRGPVTSNDRTAERLNDAQRSLFLRADKLIPTTGKPLRDTGQNRLRQREMLHFTDRGHSR